MKKNVYITRVAKFLPNSPVDNDTMEDRLGKIGGKPSRVKSIILRQNQIKTRYYAIDESNQVTHTNADLVVKAIGNLLDNKKDISEIQLICCGSSSPDQMLPSLAAMVHGELPNSASIEVMSPSGVCCTGSTAFKYGYMSVLAGCTNNAICTGSELFSTMLLAKNYEKEYDELKKIENNPLIAFEKDFLRWMLSDGAGAFLLEDKPNNVGLSFRVDWIESISYANELKTCMYQAADRTDEGDLISWKLMSENEWLKQSIFSIKQDTRYLGKHGVKKSVEIIRSSLEKNNIDIQDIDYFLPHISSMYFHQQLKDALNAAKLHIPDHKWFLNLTSVGNIGAAAIYVMVEELFHSGRLQKGEKLFLFVPESGRFSYATILLTVV